MGFLLHIGFMLCLYTILVLSTNLTVGIAGMMSLCQAAFYGIGAYAGALLLMHYQVPVLVVLAGAMLVSGLLSYVVSFAAVRLKGDYFVLATLGFQMIVVTMMNNWVSVTNGPYGLVGIPGMRLFGAIELHSSLACFLLALAAALITIVVFSLLKDSPYGRLLRAQRTNEKATLALGRNVSRVKRSAFFISSAFMGMAGALYASYIGYLDPGSFTIEESIFILSALFVGGTGNVRGPLAGAIMVVLLPELIKMVGLPVSVAGNLKQIIFGLSMIILMLFRPHGLFGEENVK